MIRIIILIMFLTFFSCSKNVSTIEKKISIEYLTEPHERIDVELLTYYPSLKPNQSNFYIVKDINTNDTLFVVDKDNLPVSNFIKEYDGIENTAIVLQKGEMKKKNEYTVNMPSKYISNKKLYLGELIRLID
ncbi:hypothetical protein [Epilithonimonas hispanica]|uniref:Uncharacterized protein n=1 Tax=Epilithonimonas hispanica TaxID=358687 RepID=A0A3D9CZA5_9FLAO|nr:hypothetical protein [Epilithonimonas hispanica]REC71099.1 hypothetical protein DRF58_07555 [Epilithonimonas hispanica]